MSEPTPESGKCGGKTRSGGKCKNAAGFKTSHPGRGRCAHHGGNTPTHIAADSKQQAAEAVKTFGLPREIDPRDALLEEVYRTAGAVDWLHQQVQALTAADVIWGRTEEIHKDAGEFPGVDTTYSATAHAWVRLWQDERKHLVQVTKAAISAGIEERKVKLAEQQGALLSDVIRRILGDLGLTPEQQQRAPEVVVRHLRAIAGGLAA